MKARLEIRIWSDGEQLDSRDLPEVFLPHAEHVVQMLSQDYNSGDIIGDAHRGWWNTASDGESDAAQKTYAIAYRPHPGNRRRSYTVGRVIDIDLTPYLFPMRDGRQEKTFGNKAAALKYARSLGTVLPGLFERDFMIPESFAIISEADACERRSVLRAKVQPKAEA